MKESFARRWGGRLSCYFAARVGPRRGWVVQLKAPRQITHLLCDPNEGCRAVIAQSVELYDTAAAQLQDGQGGARSRAGRGVASWAGRASVCPQAADCAPAAVSYDTWEDSAEGNGRGRPSPGSSASPGCAQGGHTQLCGHMWMHLGGGSGAYSSILRPLLASSTGAVPGAGSKGLAAVGAASDARTQPFRGVKPDKQ